MRKKIISSLSRPVPEWSEIVFAQLDHHKVHLFRYLLEAYDNLGYMTVVDRWGGVIKISFSPHQREEMMQALDEISETVPFKII